MKVICNKNTTRLVKGAAYEVLELSTLNTTGSKWFRPIITIKIGNESHRFSSNGFKNVDGTPIEQKNWKSSELQNKYSDLSGTHISDVRTLQKGDVIICRYSTSKKFDAGKMYKVEDVFYKKEMKQRNWSTAPNTYESIEQKIKIEGYNRWIRPSIFRLCTQQEKRTLSLGNIFEETVPVCNDFSIRKIDRMEEKQKNKTILYTIMNAMLDSHRNNLSTVEWAVQKKGKQFDIEEKDIKPFLNKKLSDLIKMCE